MKLSTGISACLMFTFIKSLYSHPCDIESAVDITDGRQISSTIHHLGVSYEKDRYFQQSGRTFGCICSLKQCIRKCCAPGNVLAVTEEVQCTESDQTLNISSLYDEGIDHGHFHVLDGLTEYNYSCPEKLYPMTLDRQVDGIYLRKSGDIYLHSGYIIKSFCVDVINDTAKPGIFYCAWTDEETSVHLHIGMIISMPFLVATFLVYALLPDRNLPAKALMCYVLSLLFAYIMLVTIQLDANLPPGACNTIAFLCYFFFMASFFWMNSSCIDIWLTFSGIKGMTGQRTQERKRFVYYCLYSWGLPLVMTGIVIFCTYYLSNSENPAGTGIGHGQCWFQNGLPTGIYFYFPIAALLITNITLFVVTALKIRNVQRDTKMLNEKDSSKHEKDKQRFNLYVKLLFAMGINWSMEVISWAVQWKLNNIPAWIWYITDFCNAMYGVLIFFIFVFKRNIWLMLKKRYLQFMGRPTQAHSMGTSTHRTTVSQVTSSEA